MRLLVAAITVCWGSVALACTGSLFHAPVQYAVAADEVLLLADLDGDGAPDILTSGTQVEQRGAFSLLRNRGDGTFADEQQVSSGFGQKLEDAADFDRDGVLDLVASDYWSNGIVVDGVPYATATHGGPTRTVDYDRDGHLDIVSFSFGSGNPVHVHLFRGRGDGTFHPKQTFETSLTVAATPSMRLRDGAPEFLVNDHSGQLAIVRVAANGISWTTRGAGPGFDLASTFADVNGDGHADIVDANDEGSLFVTLATPDGGFLERKPSRKLEFPVHLHAADVDGDGRLDLIAGDFRATKLHYFRGDGAGGFAAGVAFAAGGVVSDVAVGDVNGDQRPDVVTANDEGSVSVILNRGACGPARRRAVRQ
ncbi:MAG TPA: VCBS repeat-containing protein [Thermoanaerobaculia bacterium]